MLHLCSAETGPVPALHGLHLPCWSAALCLQGVWYLHIDFFSVVISKYQSLRYLSTPQVLARIANATRPTIHLCEVVTEQQLERLLLLLVGTDFNRGDISWGGAWAQYSLTCMLQDILAGVFLFFTGQSVCMNYSVIPQYFCVKAAGRETCAWAGLGWPDLITAFFENCSTHLLTITLRINIKDPVSQSFLWHDHI